MARNRTLAHRAFRRLRGEVVELYNKEWSAYQIMDESHRILSRMGIPDGNLRSRMLVAAWNLCTRQGMPTIEDMLANKEQFEVPYDTPSLGQPWWEDR